MWNLRTNSRKQIIPNHIPRTIIILVIAYFITQVFHQYKISAVGLIISHHCKYYDIGLLVHPPNAAIAILSDILYCISCCDTKIWIFFALKKFKQIVHTNTQWCFTGIVVKFQQNLVTIYQAMPSVRCPNMRLKN